MRPGPPTAILLCIAVPLLMWSVLPLQPVISASRPSAPESHQPVILFTAAPVYESLAALQGDERFPQGAQVMVLRRGRPEPLVPGFAASADPSVSFDATTVLFAAKQTAEDPWQIWQVGMDGGAPRRLLAADSDLIRPLWMPAGRVAFARKTATGFVLETSGLDGKDKLRLSYGPGNYIPDDVLRDGRVLFESGFPPGVGQAPEMYLVYADGSGVESVRCDHGAPREHGRQLQSGDIAFTHGHRLARFTSALADETPVAAPSGDYAGDVSEMPDGRWLLAVRVRGEKHYSIRAWKPGSGAMETLAEDAGRDLVEPVVVAPRTVPNRHPSALHDWSTGNLLALDVRQSREGDLTTTPSAVRVETTSATGQSIVLGTAPVEKDGSFFVQAAADRPLRFILLDAQGKTLREQHGWMWIRRGEQRICVGCHTGPERAPENRVPLILLRSTTPTGATGPVIPGTTGGR